MNEIPFDRIGYWSEIKLDIVKKYAAAYSTILSKEHWIKRHVYIDAFAGWGIHVSKTSGEFVEGSPTNALNISPPFSEFHFIDLDDKRVEALRKLSSNQSNVFVNHGDCNKLLLENAFPRCGFGDYARGLCLLDPYGLNINWSVLETAGKMGSIEVFCNFMIMDANRNVLWRDPDKVSQAQRDRFTAVWGDESWQEAAYRQEAGLFGPIEEKESNKSIVTAFARRLKEVAGFKFVPDPIPMKNKSGAIIYYLCFASANKTGAKIVNDIFNSYRDR